MRIPPLYICPDCEGPQDAHALRPVRLMQCSRCAEAMRHAMSGADRLSLREQIAKAVNRALTEPPGKGMNADEVREWVRTFDKN